MSKLPIPCLCLVTNRKQSEDKSLEQIVAEAVQHGANMVQLREKDLPAKQLLSIAYRLRELTWRKALLFVNDRVDIALASGADGVQLGEESLPLEASRRLASNQLLMGRSVHSLDGAIDAETEGADLLVLGTMFQSNSHPGTSGSAVRLMEQITSQVSIPVLAIGGVNADNVGTVIKSGASGAAVITAITQSNDPGQATRELKEHMKQAWVSELEKKVRTPK